MRHEFEESPGSRALFASLWRRRWLLAVVVAIATAAALVEYASLGHVYRAQARVFVGSAGAGEGAAGADGFRLSGRLLESFAEYFRSRSLATNTVIRRGLPVDPQSLSSRVDATVVEGTRIIEVGVSGADPVVAQRWVNALAEVFVEDFRRNFGSGVRGEAEVVEPAVVPTQPAGASAWQTAGLAALTGLMLGAGGVSLVSHADSTIRGPDDARDAIPWLPIVGVVPAKSRRRRGQLGTSPSAREAFHRIAAGLQLAPIGGGARAIVIASPLAGEGTTEVALALASALAAEGRATTLVESDLRRPALCRRLNLGVARGITDVVMGRAEVSEILVQTDRPRLTLVPSGPTPPNPTEVLGSSPVAELLERVGQVSEAVVLDSPPVLPFTDASILGALTDGVLVVVRAGRTRKGHLRDCVATLDRAGVTVLGLILNGVRPVEGSRDEEEPDRESRLMEHASPPWGAKR